MSASPAWAAGSCQVPAHVSAVAKYIFIQKSISGFVSLNSIHLQSSDSDRVTQQAIVHLNRKQS